MGIWLVILSFLAASFSNIKVDSVQLILNPDCCLKSSKAANKELREFSVSVIYMRMSSAKTDDVGCEMSV